MLLNSIFLWVKKNNSIFTRYSSKNWRKYCFNLQFYLGYFRFDILFIIKKKFIHNFLKKCFIFIFYYSVLPFLVHISRFFINMKHTFDFYFKSDLRKLYIISKKFYIKQIFPTAYLKKLAILFWMNSIVSSIFISDNNFFYWFINYCIIRN